jgi:hypothetical protein
MVAMATCNLCPPGSRDVPDDEMEEHLRTSHPEVAEENSTVISDVSLEPVPDHDPGASDWRPA